MGYAVGTGGHPHYFIGYGIPAQCDQPGCEKQIDRGQGYACMGRFSYDDDDERCYDGEPCGLFFCTEHGGDSTCEACEEGRAPFEPTPDLPEWVDHVLTDESWAQWRDENPGRVALMRGEQS